ncbi:MAG: TRAP transporter small permease, partial [Oscillospiraceae bacterium]|nr:TRAP transporter small permease [Oscillospiraceae bacterium]
MIVTERLMKVTKRLIEAVNVLSCAAMVIMMLTIIADVFLRMFSRYVPGQLEIVSCGMVCVVWFAVGRCALKEEMIQVNIFKVGPVVEFINKLIVIALCAVATIGAVKEGLIAMRLGTGSSILKIPKYPFMWVTAFGFFTVISAVSVLLLYARRKKQDPEALPEEELT